METRSSPLRALLGLLAAAALLQLGSPGCQETIAIVGPSAGVTLAPAVEVAVSLSPPLGSQERLGALVRAGIDTRDGGMSEDRTNDLLLSPDRRSATLAVELLPGRNRLTVWRSSGQGKEQRFVTAKRVFDRGGFHGAKAHPFAAAVGQRTLSRPATLAPGELRHLPIATWHPIAPEAAALPTLVFSHGNCGWESQVSYLMADLASIGFLVVAPGHVGNTVDDPDCADFLSLSFEERLDDVRAVLDALPEWSGTPGDPIEGLLDPERIGAAGYSAGGFTVIPIVAEDPRLAALLTLATPVANPALFPLPVPGLVLAGTLDTTAPPSWVQMFLYDLMAPPRFMATIVDATHGSFATHCPLERCILGDADLETLHRRITRIVRAFLGRYLAGDLRWEPQLSRAEGTRLRSDP